MSGTKLPYLGVEYGRKHCRLLEAYKYVFQALAWLVSHSRVLSMLLWLLQEML